MHSIRLSDVPTLFTVALCHVGKRLRWSNATQRRWEYVEELLIGFWLPVEEEPEPQDVDDDHQQTIRPNQPEPSFRPVNDPHQHTPIHSRPKPVSSAICSHSVRVSSPRR